MRALAMTGMVTAALIPSIMAGSDIRATPPSRRMSAGTRARATQAGGAPLCFHATSLPAPVTSPAGIAAGLPGGERRPNVRQLHPGPARGEGDRGAVQVGPARHGACVRLRPVGLDHHAVG